MGKREINRNRLKSARVYRGLSLYDVGGDIGTSRQALSLYEVGGNTPRPSIMKKISAKLDFPENFFFEEDDFNVKILQENFYSGKIVKSKVQGAIKEEVIMFLKIHDILSNNTLNQAKALPSFDINNSLYTLLRNYWEIGEKPILDLKQLMQSKGILIMATDNDIKDSCSIVCDVNGKTKYVVVLKRKEYSTHELNLILAKELWFLLVSIENTSLSEKSISVLKKASEEFAMEFLLPKDRFKADIIYPNKLSFYYHIEARWGVCVDVLIKRAYKVNLLNYNQYIYLNNKYSTQVEDNKISLTKDFGLITTEFEEFIKTEINNGDLTIDKIANILSICNLSIGSYEVARLLNISFNEYSKKAKDII